MRRWRGPLGDDARRLLRAWPLFLVAATAIVTAADAAPVDLSQAYRQRVALVIGINTYTNGWSQLSYARSDAEAVGRKLESLGFRVEYLLDEQATRDRIAARLSALKDQVGERDQVFIYFSGHGDTLTSGTGERKKQFGYIVPADGDRRDTFRTGISLEKLRELSGLLVARHVMFALDACFTGAILKPRGERGAGGVREGTPEFIQGALARPVRFVLTAGTAGQTAVEVDGAGLFTRQLLRALDGAALPPERGVPILTGNDIGSYVRRTVREIARQRYRKTQTPVYGDMEGEGDGEFLVAVRAAPPPPPPPVPAGVGSLVIRAREPAEVWLGDRSLGEARPGDKLVVMDVRAGTYPVRARFRRQGLRPWEGEARVVAGERVVIDIEPLRPTPTKLNIAIPEFTVIAGVDTAGTAKMLASVAGDDLTFSGLFSVVAGTTAITADNPEALKRLWSDFAAAGAHAGLHGLLALRPDRLEAEMRLYDVTTPEQRLIATKMFLVGSGQPRRLAHKIADEVVRQFTGEPGIADTKIAYVVGQQDATEIHMADYDGHSPTPITRGGSISHVAWSPDARSLAYALVGPLGPPAPPSGKRDGPHIRRVFPFERRPQQILAAFMGINTAPSWSPDGRSVAMALSKDGDPEIYVLTLATGTMRRFTRHVGVDTEPTWSPTGRELAFVSDRTGSSEVFVMDADGVNLRQLTVGGGHSQPRWSPRGDQILYTRRINVNDIWIMSSDGADARRLTAGPGDKQNAVWAPDGRHILFQSNMQGKWDLFTMFPDGSDQRRVFATRDQIDRTAPAWSPRLP